MKIAGIRYETQGEHEKNMYYDAAKRVVFRNCMNSCDISDEQLPNFNGNFYYNMVNEQKCLATCFNTKMNLHFGATTAKKENLYMDFEAGKQGYQVMENWNPTYKITKQFEKGESEEYINDITSKLINRTKAN